MTAPPQTIWRNPWGLSRLPMPSFSTPQRWRSIPRTVQSVVSRRARSTCCRWWPSSASASRRPARPSTFALVDVLVDPRRARRGVGRAGQRLPRRAGGRRRGDRSPPCSCGGRRHHARRPRNRAQEHLGRLGPVPDLAAALDGVSTTTQGMARPTISFSIAVRPSSIPADPGCWTWFANWTSLPKRPWKFPSTCPSGPSSAPTKTTGEPRELK